MTGKKQVKPTQTQLDWLRRGLSQPGGKLPLCEKTVKSCIDHGWAAPWFDNPIKPDWLICKLTDEGRRVATSVADKNA
jgi:hypothetical protein